MRMQKKKKTSEAKKVVETFRVFVDRKLSATEKRNVEDKIKQIIKQDYGKV